MPDHRTFLPLREHQAWPPGPGASPPPAPSQRRNGRFSLPNCLPRCRPGHRARPTCGKSSTPSSIACTMAVPGAPCPTTSPPRGRSATTSTAGGAGGCGNASTMSCAARSARPRAAPRSRPPPSSTASRRTGSDAGSKVKGSKRHLVVDTLGLLLCVVVHPASIQDRDGAQLVLSKARGRFPQLRLIWADGGYAGKLIAWVLQVCAWVLEIVKRSDTAKGWVLLPRRWAVERTFGWLSQCRALALDDRFPLQ